MTKETLKSKIRIVKVLKIAISVFFDLIMVSFCLMIVFLLVQANRSGRHDLFGYQLVKIETDSMMPVLAVDDVILVKTVSIIQLEQGDIITFLAGDDSEVAGAVITHRVVSDVYFDEALDEYVVRTAGDREVQYDEDYFSDTVTNDRLYGVMIRKIGIITYFVSGNSIARIGLLFIFPVIAFAFGIFYTVKINKKYIEAEKEEKIASIEERKKQLEEEIAKQAVEDFKRKLAEAAALKNNDENREHENSETKNNTDEMD